MIFTFYCLIFLNDFVRCKMKKKVHYLFISYICSIVSDTVIIITINMNKGCGGNYAMLLDDFA